MGKCTIIIGDALQVLPQLQPGSIDLTISDPPYISLERHRKIGTTTRLKESASSSNPWFETIPNDALLDMLALLFKAHKLNSVLRMFCDEETASVALTGSNPFVKQSPHLLLQRPWFPWPSWTWFKTKKEYECVEEGNFDEEALRIGMGYHGRHSTERVLYLEKGKTKINDLAQPDCLFGPRAGKLAFPSQKPQSALLPLVKCHSNPGDLILDPFAGSGGVATAALSLNRNAILIEKHNNPWLQATAEALVLAEHSVEWKLSA